MTLILVLLFSVLAFLLGFRISKKYIGIEDVIAAVRQKIVNFFNSHFS